MYQGRVLKITEALSCAAFSTARSAKMTLMSMFTRPCSPTPLTCCSWTTARRNLGWRNFSRHSRTRLVWWVDRSLARLVLYSHWGGSVASVLSRVTYNLFDVFLLGIQKYWAQAFRGCSSILRRLFRAQRDIVPHGEVVVSAMSSKTFSRREKVTGFQVFWRHHWR